MTVKKYHIGDILEPNNLTWVMSGSLVYLFEDKEAFQIDASDTFGAAEFVRLHISDTFVPPLQVNISLKVISPTQLIEIDSEKLLKTLSEVKDTLHLGFHAILCRNMVLEYQAWSNFFLQSATAFERKVTRPKATNTLTKLTQVPLRGSKI